MLRRFLLWREARDACRVVWQRFPPKAAPRAVRSASTEDLNTANLAARETTANGGKSSRANYDAIILTCRENEQWDRVLSLFVEMRDHNIEPTKTAHDAAVTACWKTGRWDRMAELIQTRQALASVDSTEMSSATDVSVESEPGSGGDDTPLGIEPCDAAQNAAELARANLGSAGRVRHTIATRVNGNGTNDGPTAGLKRQGKDPDKRWDRSFALLSRYRAREGHCRVPSSHREEHRALGKWISRQRTAYRKGELSNARKDRLGSVGMVWEVRLHQGRTWRSLMWDESFSLLSRYRAREGDCRVPQRHVEDDHALGRWVSRQRTAHRKGELSVSRKERLESLGMVWEQGLTWDGTFALLSRYRAREGHCAVPLDHAEDGRRLGRWVARQRTAHRKGELSAVRKERLESLGIVWEQGLTWDGTFALLSRYRAREGHCAVPHDHAEDGRRIGWWVTRQRTAHRKG